MKNKISWLYNLKISKETLKDMMFHVFLPVCIGGIIYVLLRQENTYLFVLIQKTIFYEPIMYIRNELSSQNKNIPSILLFSLPDGIWVYSSTYLMLIIWKGNNKNFVWIAAPFIIVIVIELMQAIQLFQGTFCVYDMIFYILGFLVSLLEFRRKYGKSIC